MRLWWCNQAKVRFGGWGHVGLDRDKQGKQESESAESRDMEVASAIFVEASCCSQAESVRLPAPQEGRRSRELDDRSSCHQTASKRDKSPHCTDEEAGEAIHRTASSLARLFCLGKETTHAETRWRQQEQFGTTKFQGCNTVFGYQGQHWISVQFSVLDPPTM